MSDLISRQEAIAHLKHRLYETQLNIDTEHPYYEEIADNRIDVWMNEVPSVKPEQKPGKWSFCASAEDLMCSNCLHYWIPNGDQYDYHYCPNCGARMDGETECD